MAAEMKAAKRDTHRDIGGLPRACIRFCCRRLYSGLYKHKAELGQVQVRIKAKPNSGVPEFGLSRRDQKLVPEIDPVSERWRYR